MKSPKVSQKVFNELINQDISIYSHYSHSPTEEKNMYIIYAHNLKKNCNCGRT